MIVAVLVATAVYDHGVVGVYTGEDAVSRAEGEAAAIWAETDGHHRFRIDVMETDVSYPDAFHRRYSFAAQSPPVGMSVPIEIKSRVSATRSSTL